MSQEEQQQAKLEHARCAVITISDTRTTDADRSGTLMRKRLEGAGHTVARYGIVPDEPAQVEQLLDALAGEVDVALFNGGTSLSNRTYDTLVGKLDRELPGFGELFRRLSYEEIGADAMRLRATAGLHRQMLVFATPGALDAVKRAMDRLITSQLTPLMQEMRQEHLDTG